MNPYLKRAREIAEEITENRRYIHAHAGVGFDLGDTVERIMSQLEAMGIKGEKCGKAGVVVTLGKPGKTILLRGDIDALPIAEQTGLPFASQTGAMHACGHDFHASMLLGAARLLKETEDSLEGTVKLMFQPAEEKLLGAKDMVENGVLENPKVDAALAIHIGTGNEETKIGSVRFTKGPSHASGDSFRIIVQGKGCHGASSYQGVDAVSVAAHIVVALEQIPAREVPADQLSIVTVGVFQGGSACNIIADTAVLEGTIRALDPENRLFLIRRVREIAQGVAQAFRATVTFEEPTGGTPPSINDPALCDQMLPFIQQVVPADQVIVKENSPSLGSEDFAYVSTKVPSMMLNLGAGSTDQGFQYALHSPFVTPDEGCLPVGAALYAHCAASWLASASPKQG